MQRTPKHDEDFYGWAVNTASLLKQQKYHEVDMNSIIEELEEMSRSEKRELVKRLSQLLKHLLKWQYQPMLRGNSWQISIKKQRRGIARIIKENPSLKSKISDCLVEAYEDALDDTVDETGLSENVFPKEYPYTFQQIMKEDFLPTD